MTDQNHHLDTLKDIKQMMERSSRFISLSGLSGIAAGICALIGAWFAHGIIDDNKYAVTNLRSAPADVNNSITAKPLSALFLEIFFWLDESAYANALLRNKKRIAAGTILFRIVVN